MFAVVASSNAEFKGSTRRRQTTNIQPLTGLVRGAEVPGKTGEAVLGHIYATMGRKGEALKVIEEFKEAARQIYVDPTHVAAIYAGLRAEQTLAWLEKGYQERSSWMIYLNSDPRYDWLRANPKFQSLLRRVGFGATG